jgi:Flp pilus assembly protein TadD
VVPVLIRACAISAALCATLLGCAAIEGARLYSEGTRALERGDTENAVRSLERAAERAPDASEIQNHLGIAYLSAGRRDDALHAFERAVALDCGNAAAQRNLALLRDPAAP